MTSDAPDEKRLDPRPRQTVVRTDRLLVVTTASAIGLGLFVFLYIVNDKPAATPTTASAQAVGSPVAPTDPRGYDLLTRVEPIPDPAPASVPAAYPVLPVATPAPVAPVDQEAEAARTAAPAFVLRNRRGQSAERPTMADVLQSQQKLLANSIASLEGNNDPAGLASLASAMAGGSGQPSPQAVSSVETNLKFARSGMPEPGDDGWSRQRLLSPKSRYEVKAGTILTAALRTALHSDLPGDIVAQLTHDVRDSVTGRSVLLPAGTTVIGRTNSAIGAGQDRIQVIWTRLVLPNGKELALDSLSGADKTGAAGVADRVDYHYESIGLGVVLSTILSVGGNLARGTAGYDRYSLRQSVGDSVAQSASSAGSRIVDRQLNIPPTITVREGTPVTAIVSRTMVLEPYQPQQ